MNIFNRFFRLFLLIIITILNLQAVEPIDFSILTDVKIDTVGKLKVIINWNLDSNAKEYIIKRKLLNDKKWSKPLAELDSTALRFVDSTIEPGTGYEYYLKKKSVIYTDTTNYIYEGFSYIYAGYQLKDPDYKGRLLLLVDNTISQPLNKEINSFIYDLTGDGWNVVRTDVPRTEEFDGNSVKNIKNIIVNEFNTHPDSLSALILLGRIAVPYSGDFAVDGHQQHQGAWVADTYYADIDGVWTDETVYDTTAERIENKNIPLDGKFDQNQIASDVEIQIGRIDFYNLTYYNISEIELYRNYLIRNHNFRQGIIKPEFKGIIDDNFGMYNEPFASNGWSNFSSLLGAENTIAEEFVMPEDSPPKLFAYGCGSGSYYSIERTIYLNDFDTNNTGGIFSMLLGSYNGDWDIENNILRAQLAYSKFGLTCSWSGRPFWHCHHMGMNLPVGYSTKISQNNQYTYLTNDKYGYRFVHISLLGDPTLRMYNEEPPRNLYLSSEVSYDSSKIYLNWNAGNDMLIGFNIYRSGNIYGKFEKLNNFPISDSIFIDNSPLFGKNIYMVRAVRQRETATGTLVNMSQGVFAETDIPILSYSSLLNYSLKCYPNPAENFVNITFVVPEKEKVVVSIWDLNGKLVKQLVYSRLNPRYYIYNWNLQNQLGEKVQSGTYFIHLETNNKTLVKKLQIIN